MHSIRKFIAKAREIGIIVNAPRCNRAYTVFTPENIKAVAKIVCENMSTATRHRSQEFNTAIYVEFYEKISPYKVQLV